ncbi:hypothetical protein K445DRAFT_211745 [Daldinia sp. EC12]|nr:hypothetical protein K445DRAFT_211745 [Daldinia sp. EC12]
MNRLRGEAVHGEVYLEENKTQIKVSIPNPKHLRAIQCLENLGMRHLVLLICYWNALLSAPAALRGP